jgi:uncharacterized repeat protein (TIGR01451 family)
VIGMLLLLIGGWAHATTCDLQVSRESPFYVTAPPVKYRVSNLGPDTCNARVAISATASTNGYTPRGWAGFPPDLSPPGGYSVLPSTPDGMTPITLSNECRDNGRWEMSMSPSQYGYFYWTCDQQLASGQAIVLSAQMPYQDWPGNCPSIATGVVNPSQRPAELHPWDYGSILDPEHSNNYTWLACQAGGNPGPANVKLKSTKTATPVAVTIGDTVTYQVAAKNTSSGDPNIQYAQDVSLVDVLPAGLDYVSATAANPASCTYKAATRTVTCKQFMVYPGYSLAAQIVAKTTATGIITNACSTTATVGAGGTLEIDDTACNTPVSVAGIPHVTVTKTAASGSVGAGQPIGWTITANSTGSADASNVVVTDTVPAGVTGISASGAGWTCSVSGQTVTCSRPTLAMGAQATIVVAGTAPTTPSTITNTCVVSATGGTTDSSACNVSTTITPRSLVTLTKSATPNPVRAGQPITWTIGVNNAGPNAASNVTVSDTLPAGVTNIVPSGSGWSCSTSGQTVTCSRGSLPVGSAPITIAARAPTTTGSITNTCVAAADPGATMDVTGCRVTSTVDPYSHIVVSKTASATSLPVGSAISWTLNVTNQGPSAASNVVITDAVPAGVTAISASGTGWTCNVSGQTVTCSRASMAVGNAPITISGTAPTTTGSITNTCTATAATDPAVDVTACRATTTLTQQSRITVTKTASPNPVQAGAPITWTLTVANAGPSTASNVTITDAVPAGVTGISAAGTGWSCNVSGQTVTCSRASVPVGNSQITITGNAPATAGSITNTCVASGDATTIFDTTNCRATTTVDPVSGITLSKSATPNPVLAGEPITWTITVVQSGPSSATNVQITDTLPAGVVVQSANWSVGGFGSSCAISGQIVTCSRASLAPGTSAISIIGKAPVTPGQITNTCVGTAGAGTTVSDGACRVDTVVQPNTHVTVAKRASAAAVPAATPISWTLDVSNSGPSPASNVVITDAVPAGVTGISAAGAGWSCGVSGQTVTCSIASLAVGSSQVTISGTAPTTPGVITNTCVIATPDDAAADSSACRAVTSVGTNAQVVVSKSATPNPVLAGQPITWTISVDNAGPSIANNVVVTDTVPAGVTSISASGAGWTCNTSGQTVTCAAPSLAVGNHTIGIVGNAPSTPGPITNVCVATADAGQAPDTAACTVTTTVQENAEVVVSKTASAASVAAGTPVSWTLSVDNRGASVARDLRIIDTVPAGVTGITATSADGYTCAVTGSVVECTRASQPVGIATITIAGIAPLVPGAIENICTATAASLPAPDDTACRAQTDVTANTQIHVTKTAAAPQVPAGGQVVWTIDVTNDGPGIAVNPVVTDTVPAGVTGVTASGVGWSCDVAGQTVTCTRPLLSVGLSSIVVAGTAPDEPTTLRNVCVYGDASSAPLEYNCRVDTEIVRNARLVTRKTAPPDDLLAGELIPWTITVTNLGPSTAADVTVIDTLPVGVTSPTVDGSPLWSCSTSGLTITCTAASVPVGDSTIRIAALAPTMPGSITNTCAASTTDSTPVDNTACIVKSVVTANAAVTVTKTAEPARVVAGEPITWTLHVSNAGPGEATNLVVTDPLPNGVADPVVVSSTGAAWSCSIAGLVVTCTTDHMPVGTGDITISATAPVEPGEVRNTCVVATDADPSPSVGGCSVTTPVDRSAELSVTKRATQSTVRAGEGIDWIITVTNRGPSSAADLVVTDTLPAGVSNVTASGAGWTCSVSAQAVTCSRPSLGVTTSEIAIHATAPDEPGELRNTCVLAATDITPDSSGCVSTTPVTGHSDVTATKRSTQASVGAGEPIAWIIEVSNAGPSTANNVVVTDAVPAGVTGINASGAGWACSVSGQAVTCSRASLGVETSQINVSGIAPLDAGQITNTCVLAVDGGTPDPSSCSTTTEITPTSEISVVKTATQPTVRAGSEIEWILTVSNTGTGNARNVVVVDDMPSGVTNPIATGAGWSCAVTGQRVTCSRAVVPPGTSTISIRATAPATPGTIRNVCVVAVDGGTAYQSFCSTSTEITPSSVLSVAKRSTTPTVVAGEPIEWVISVSNAGPDAAANVVVTDELPAGVTEIAADGDGWSCAVSGQVVTCSRASLAVGSSDVHVHGRAPTQPGELRNTCVVAADALAASLTECGSTTPIVKPSADLEVTKTARVLPAGKDDAVRVVEFHVHVTNVGQHAAENVSLTDVWPAGIERVGGVELQDWTCTDVRAAGATAGSFECVRERLDPRQEADLLVYASVPASALTKPMRVTNVVTVASDTDDANPANNRAEASADLDAVDPGNPGDPNGSVQPVPTLDGFGLLALVLLVAVAAMRRRRLA